MKLNDLLEATTVVNRIGEGNPDILSIVHDSRDVAKGSLFFAIHGFKTDGSIFTENAIQRGAVAVIGENPTSVSLTVPFIQVSEIRKTLAELSWKLAANPEQRLRLIGITGTNGKTTIASVLSHILNENGTPCGSCGTLGIHYGDTHDDSPRTTPEADVLAPHLSRMANSGIAACAIETTSIGIALNRVHGLPFEIAVFTNLSRDHLDFHGSWGAYLDAKLELFRQIPASGTSIINLDDEHAVRFIHESSAPVLTFAIMNVADYQATNTALGHQGIEFDIQHDGNTFHICSPLIGKFNVYNLVASFAAAHRMGLPVKGIINAIKTVPCVRGRAEIVPSSAPFSIVVDYAHTPDALTNILSSIAELKPNRILTIIGAGGDRDRGKRPDMTKAAEQFSDFIFLTSDNPRTEDPNAILQDMAAGIIDPLKFVIIADRHAAIENALQKATDGDVVVIAGKGHETYQEINGKKYPFDDRQIALEWLVSKDLSA